MWSVRYMWMGLMPVLFGYWPNVNLKFRPAPRGQLVGFHSLGYWHLQPFCSHTPCSSRL